MNEHLSPVFDLMLPAIEQAGFPYWVYGGVSVAGVVGHFFRDNPDVDIYVRVSDYSGVRDVLKTLCKTQGAGWFLLNCTSDDETRRKLEVHVGIDPNTPPSLCGRGATERLSVVNAIATRAEIPADLEPTTRRLERHVFGSLPDDLVKEIFRQLMIEHPEQMAEGKRRIDAECLLPAELADLEKRAYADILRRLREGIADAKKASRYRQAADIFKARGLWPT